MPKRLTPRGEAAPPVEPIITGATLPTRESAQKSSGRKPKKSSPGVMYVRNLHHIMSRVTLASGRQILLQPRGQRDDIDIVNKEEQQDPKFLANKDLLFELIDGETAERIIYKQQHNRRQGGVMQHLRNEKGEAYTQTAATIEEVFENQGEVVGTIEETGSGRFTDHNQEVRRSVGPQRVSRPGSPEDPATDFMDSVPGNVDPEEYHDFLLWKQFKAEQKRQGK